MFGSLGMHRTSEFENSLLLPHDASGTLTKPVLVISMEMYPLSVDFLMFDKSHAITYVPIVASSCNQRCCECVCNASLMKYGYGLIP